MRAGGGLGRFRNRMSAMMLLAVSTANIAVPTAEDGDEEGINNGRTDSQKKSNLMPYRKAGFIC